MNWLKRIFSKPEKKDIAKVQVSKVTQSRHAGAPSTPSNQTVSQETSQYNPLFDPLSPFNPMSPIWQQNEAPSHSHSSYTPDVSSGHSHSHYDSSPQVDYGSSSSDYGSSSSSFDSSSSSSYDSSSSSSSSGSSDW